MSTNGLPKNVIPIWTLDRNRPGSAASRMAVMAPRLPLSAITFSRAVRDETMASSDIASTPFTRVREKTRRISSHMAVRSV
jgi:hypothetical protein